MVLVSFKNNGNWPSDGKKWCACPYLGIRFLVITQPFLDQLDWNFSWDFRPLSIDWWWEIWGYDRYFSVLIFGPLLVGKWAWPPLAPLMVWSLQTKPKWVDLLGQSLSRNHVFEIYRGEPPPCLICTEDKRTRVGKVIMKNWSLAKYCISIVWSAVDI